VILMYGVVPPCVQVVLVLLEEDHAERQSLRTTTSQTDALSFSEGSLQLNTQLPFLYGTNHAPRYSKHSWS